MDHRLKGASPLNTVRKQPATLSGEIWGVTAYFNPARYPNKIAHLRLFSERIRKQGLKLLIIEAVFADQPFDVAKDFGDIVIRLKADDILWQKERLLNIAVKELPPQCDKVVWLDADIIFTNQDWVEQTAELLQTYIVVQPFSRAWWTASRYKDAPLEEILRNYQVCHEGSGQGAAYLESNSPSSVEIHGHVGFAWAARRELICKHGIYDRSITPGADTLISAPMFGFSEYPALELACSPAQVADARRWMESFYADVRQSVFYTDGDVVHLWHGSRGDRQYLTFLMLFKQANFDPASDIAIASNGCWRWSSDKPELHKQVKAYFWSRRDDECCATLSCI